MISQIEAYLSPEGPINRDAIARIVYTIGVVLPIAALAAIIITAIDHNWNAVWVLSGFLVSLGMIFWLTRHGLINTAIFILALTLLLLSVTLATVGQGIHDITNVVYPGILVVASLILNRRAFFILTALTLLAVSWLVLGAKLGFFVPRPPEVGTLADLFIVAILLIATAFCTYTLSHNLLQSLIQVNEQILIRQQAEQALRESQTMLQLIFDHVFDGISVYEEDLEHGTRRLIDCNNRYAELAGRSKEELLARGDTLDIQVSIDNIEPHADFIRRFDQDMYMGRFSWMRPDGQENIIEYAAVPRRFGERLIVIGVDHDITAQVKAEAEREAMIKALEVKNAELERFTYTVSHDLKSPLITIKGFLNFLKQDIAEARTDQINHDIALIAEAADKMQQLLDELLELSRAGRLINPIPNVALAEVVREALKLVSGQLTARGVEVTVASDMPTVTCDRQRLREVFENLLSNAVKFMGDQPNPRIEIGVRHEGTRQVIYVRDNGIGIAQPYHEKVFNLFTKLDTHTEGSGIGLAIVKRIIESHRGQVWVESEGPGHGSTFCFTLPPLE